MLAVGFALIFCGNNVTKYLPPNYNGEDDFAELLKRMGDLFKGGGFLFLVAGVVCILLQFSV